MITDTIHCKVSYNGQIRRFALDCTEFTSLKETIAKLFSDNEFVLKYRDDESDYVTLDSQEDLMTALSISPKLLCIFAHKNDAAPTINDDSMSFMYRKKFFKHHERGQHGPRGHHGPHGQHGPYGHHGQPHFQLKSNEWRTFRQQKRLSFMNQCLADLGSDDSQLTPRALLKKQKLIRKKQIIESCLRGECYDQKKKRGLLTPEDEQRNSSLKVQILTVKMDLLKIKSRQGEIKMMLQEKADDKPLLDELAALKEQKNLLTTQKRDLHDQAHLN
jgi:hypothetical protein